MAYKTQIARSYAKAIFQLACETKKQSQWYQFLYNLFQLFQEEAIKQFLLQNPQRHSAMVEWIIEMHTELCHSVLYATDSLRLLALKRHLQYLPSIFLMYKKLLEEIEQKITIRLETVFALESREKENFEKLFIQYLGKQVSMEYFIEPGLLGGFLARADNLVIDGSLRGTLKQLKAKLDGELWV
jgi:F-type H+-transporting ATPase subunit delta